MARRCACERRALQRAAGLPLVEHERTRWVAAYLERFCPHRPAGHGRLPRPETR
ncbi:hypothetical protein I598_1911 [Isoptericola dokdonensis DS-3]|uniref:Uncharacterized protein n=1 Tax=Isoptericola dokdonensis DS-3 TaxID=1300344 RepID=A0A168FDP5_9MICO|nr:hypothetical protein I598_1911 [Isoptericola dokdonensis DS-3]